MGNASPPDSDQKEGAAVVLNQRTPSVKGQQPGTGTSIPRLSQPETELLAAAIKALNDARLEFVGVDDVNFGFDLYLAERQFLAGVVYKNPEALERCWDVVRIGLQRARLCRAGYGRRR